ncbi:TauD/TfdA dioxygenase family protein [Providencia rettgeri]|uniref:TauD/TfdA dioxygenase family protein n=1 Tax=Providencia sp. TaxID=589 RepID=UPI0024AC1B1E|nr:TauD/TfdA family dioxygenase [Providencia rettgeri]
MNIDSLNNQIELIKPFGLLITSNKAYQDISVLPINRLRQLTREHGLVILRYFQSGFANTQKLVAYSQQWGEIMMWPFGEVLDVQEQANPSDHILDNGHIPLHWDGMYRETVPEFQIFHCVLAPMVGQGGCTTFVNTEKLINELNDDTCTLWKNTVITYKTKQVTHYGGEVTSPLICLHPNGHKWVMRYNEPMRTIDEKYSEHHSLSFSGIAVGEQNHFKQNLNKLLYDPQYCYAHQWEAGDILMCDNFTLIHGRDAFFSQAPRHIQRVHIHSSPIYVNPHFCCP